MLTYYLGWTIGLLVLDVVVLFVIFSWHMLNDVPYPWPRKHKKNMIQDQDLEDLTDEQIARLVEEWRDER